MAAPDPVDIRLLTLVAELGKAAVHEIGARIGMDPREVASRLVALSATGLPLIVGVECDPHGLRNAIAGAGAWLNYAAQVGGSPQGTPSGAYPVSAPANYAGQPAGFVPGQPGQQPYGSGPYPPPNAPRPPVPSAGPPPRLGPPSTPFPAPSADPMSTWGPPQSSSWARGDQPTRPAYNQPPAQPGWPGGGSGPHQVAGRQGKVGDQMRIDPGTGQIAIRLVEVVDPADFLFSAAGYRLREGERAVVVHTELTNEASAPFPVLPDLYLMLVSPDGQTVSKAPVSLSSRPPHRMGVPPGETAGGHTVYVLPEATEITTIRWSAKPDDEAHTLTWSVDT